MNEQLDVIKRARLRVAERVTDLIGDTPIVRLHKFERDTPGVELWAKCEFLNPGGSVKDRAAYQMIRDAIRTGRAQARPDDHRLDQRQHRRRLLAHRRRARLPGHAGDAGQRLVGAAQDHRGVRHDAGLLRSDGGLRRRDPAVPQDGRREPRPLLLSRPVLEPVEPARPLQHDRARDLGADRGARHPLRDRHRHHRHGDGDGTAPQGVPPRHRGLGGRAGRRAARPRGAQAHGELARPRHLPPRRAQRRAADGHRRGVGRLRAAGEGRGSAGRPLVGRVAGGRAAHRQAAGGRRQAGRHRHAVPRPRRALLRGAGPATSWRSR